MATDEHPPARSCARLDLNLGFDLDLSLPDGLALVRWKLAKVPVASALIAVVGGHWAILQCIAWCGMVISFSQDSSLSSALEKTFSGRNPCVICKVVKEGREAEEQREFVKVEQKLDLWLARPATLLEPPPAPVVAVGGPQAAVRRPESPPTPPPRRA